MKRLIKSNNEDNVFNIIVEYTFDDSDMKDIYSVEEVSIVDEILATEFMCSVEDVAINVIQLLKYLGFTATLENGTGYKPSPNNKEGQVSYYVFFHDSKDEYVDENDIKHIKIVGRMKVSNHTFTTRDENGNIVVDKNRVEYQDHGVGKLHSQEELEEFIGKKVDSLIPTKAVITKPGQFKETTEDLNTMLSIAEIRLREFRNEYYQTEN